MLSVPLGVVCGAFDGVEGAVAAFVSSAVVIANLWVLSVLGPRLVTSLAREESPMLWAAALAAKFALLIGVFLGMLRVFPPMGVAMGFVPLLVGTLATGIQLARADAAAEEA